MTLLQFSVDGVKLRHMETKCLEIQQSPVMVITSGPEVLMTVTDVIETDLSKTSGSYHHKA